MKRIDVDFNAMTDDNRVILNTRGLQSIAGESLSEGERVVLSDEEVEGRDVLDTIIREENLDVDVLQEHLDEGEVQQAVDRYIIVTAAANAYGYVEYLDEVFAKHDEVDQSDVQSMLVEAMERRGIDLDPSEWTAEIISDLWADYEGLERRNRGSMRKRHRSWRRPQLPSLRESVFDVDDEVFEQKRNPDSSRIRDSERRYAQTGTVTDHAVLLAARVRYGNLEPQQVIHAASLGNQAALMLELDVEQVNWRNWQSRRAVIAALNSKFLIVAYAADVAERILSTFDAERPDDARPSRVIEAARIWVADPSVENADATRRAADAAAYTSGVYASAAYASAAYASVAYTAYDTAYTSDDVSDVAAAYAADAATYVLDEANNAEHKWQRLRLADYFLREV